ncbi:hypothetical protein V3W47_07280 [Deinococcus sp. YIM 134068]|uniref:hypothetical protein n=1 Tax=Deinococcus lichenicola TaxID=3118910 RepID=UPI002F922A8B
MSPDAITLAGIVAALKFAGDNPILQKVLGPTADYVGKELQAWTERRLSNFAKIVENASTKLGDDPGEGAVSPKVLKGILDDGSFIEDRLSTEYFGGVLASSYTSNARDDRGATFTALLGRLSSYQIRAHYVFYATLYQNARGVPSNFADYQETLKFRSFIPILEFYDAMGLTAEEVEQGITSHLYGGLVREGLIGSWYSQNPAEVLLAYAGPYGYTAEMGHGVVWQPSLLGAELFLWALGAGKKPVSDFLEVSLELPSGQDLSLPMSSRILSGQ